MRFQKIVFFMFSVMFLASCKKDPPPSPPIVDEDPTIPPCDTTFIVNSFLDTIFPSDYLMAYPGSWWEYSNGQIDSCLAWEPANLFTKTVADNCVTVEIDIHVLPRMSSTSSSEKHFVLFESNCQTNESLKSTTIVPMINENIGEFYSDEISGGEWPYNYTAYLTKTTLEHLDSVEIGSQMFYDVIVIRSVDEIFYHHDGWFPPYEADFFYSKNIGLIRWIYYENEGTDIPSDTIDIVNYHIEPY